MLHTPSRPARSQPFPIAVLPRPTTVDVLDGRSQIPIVPSCLDSPRSVLPSSCLPNRFQRKCDSPCWASLLSKGLALFYSEPVPRLASFLHSELLASPQGGVAARVRKCREASTDRADGVVFRLRTKRKTTPAASASVASQNFLDDAATPPCGYARRGISLACNSVRSFNRERIPSFATLSRLQHSLEGGDIGTSAKPFHQRDRSRILCQL